MDAIINQITKQNALNNHRYSDDCILDNYDY